MAYDDIPIEPPVPPYVPPTPPEPGPTETRNIVNGSAQIIGTLKLPAGTAEAIWTVLLAFHGGLISSIPASDDIDTLVLTGSGSVTTSSGQPSLVPGMTAKPTAGSWLIFFNGSASTNGANAAGSFGLYKDGVLITETKRDISCQLQLLGGLVSISLNTIAVGTYSGGKVIVDGTNTIELKYLSSNSGTIGFSDRTMMLIKVK